jgi:nucleotide-binding universal stress UspA family protein
MKVLLATDGSRYAQEASRFLAHRLRARPEVQIDALAVYEPGDGATDSPEWSRNGGTQGDHGSTRARAAAERWVADARPLLEGPGRQIGTRVLGGPPERIVVAESRGYDLVVVGVKGRGASPFFELGRVALAVLRESDASVLLVRPTSRKEAKPFRVLLSAEEEDPGLPASWQMLLPFSASDTEVEIVTVMPEARYGMALAARTASGRGSRERSRERANRWLTRTLTSLPSSNRPVRPTLLHGRPASEVGARAVESHADLLVIGEGARSRSGEAGPFAPLGGTARELTWSSPCSVLLVRQKGTPPVQERVPSVTRETGARPTQGV